MLSQLTVSHHTLAATFDRALTMTMLEQPALAEFERRRSGRFVLTSYGVFLAAALLGGFAGRTIVLTWDEPYYIRSQELQADWFAGVMRARSVEELRGQFDRQVLLDGFHSARAGINVHPPLSGMLANVAELTLGRWMGDWPARRMASVFEFAAAAALLCWFLGRRYGLACGLVAAASLILMPRVLGHARINGTDTPLMFFWALAAIAFWEGLASRRWQIACGVCLGLAFSAKMPAVLGIAPAAIIGIVRALAVDSNTTSATTSAGRSRFVRAAFLATLIAPLAIAAPELLRLRAGMREAALERFPAEQHQGYLTTIDLLDPGVTTWVPGWLFFLPAAFWLLREIAIFAARRRSTLVALRGSPIYEMLLSCIALAPAVSILLNPLWWQDTAIRLAHYLALFTERDALVRDFEIYYFGRLYRYSLPWHNGFVLTAITVPLGISALAIAGCWTVLRSASRDLLPLYLLLGALVFPVMRMFDTPAHGVVRLMLPTFFFWAALAGVGFTALVARSRTDEDVAPTSDKWLGLTLPQRATALVLICIAPAAVTLYRTHPHYLSYYNLLVGGTTGAMDRGFEVSYWFDAVTPEFVAAVNDDLPEGATISAHAHWLGTLLGAGALRGDLSSQPDAAKADYIILQARSALSRPFRRLLFLQRPTGPVVAHDGVALASMYDDRAIARALGLVLLTDARAEKPDAITGRIERATFSETAIEVARTHPQAVVDAIRLLLDGRAFTEPDALQGHTATYLTAILGPEPERNQAARLRVAQIAAIDPQCLGDAASMLIQRPDVVEQAIRSMGMIRPERVGGYLSDAFQRAARK